MRIGVDAQTILEQSAGITYYTQGLLREILRQDKKNHYDLFLWRLFPKPLEFMFGKNKNFSYKYQRFFPYKLFYKLYKWGIPVLLELFYGKHDLYFFPNFVEYPHLSGKSVTTVYDLTFEKVPEYVAARNVEFLRKFVPGSCRRAEHIITISEATKKDIVQTYGIDKNKITVSYPAVDRGVFYPRTRQEKENIKKKYWIEKPFILYLGTLEPRKNISAILKAYASLKNRDDFNLVLAGKKGWIYEEIFELVRKLKLEDAAIFTGFVPDEDRPLLMSAADVFVFPSFFEGFGMPVVEAQACGTAVVTSNTTSLPEAAGNGAILVDPKNVAELSSSIEKILSSSRFKEELVKKGFANVRKFSWEQSAKRVTKVFNSLG